MILGLLIACLTLAVLVPVLLPLVRGLGAARDGAASDRAVYRDQLRELERDVERGLLTAAEADSARLDIQRRLLAAVPEGAPVRSGSARVLAGVTGLFVAGGALGLYLLLGTPEVRDPGGAELARLTEHLRAHPGDVEGWTMYARAASGLDRWDDAETAWRRVIALGRATPEAVAGLGETLVLRQNGQVSQEARGLFDMALHGDPGNVLARYYMALAAAQGGDPKGALAQWGALLEDLPPDSPGREDVRRRMEETARASGLPMPAPADRAAMIEGMVAGLAARLAREPGDEAGWEKLGRSYAVLGRGTAAADAYEKAAALRPEEPRLKLAAAEALLSGLKPEDAIPPRAVDLLRQVEPALPQDPAVLWYLGLAAARGGERDRARAYWTRLAKVLPPEGEDAKMVREALGALGG